MWRGFLFGSLTLIVLDVVLQHSSAVTSTSNVFAQGLRRLLSADVAGVPQRKSLPVAATASTAAGGSVTTPTLSPKNVTLPQGNIVST